MLKEKKSKNRQLSGELVEIRQEFELTRERLRQIEENQNAKLTESESTTNFLERRIAELEKVKKNNNIFSRKSTKYFGIFLDASSIKH